MTGGVPRPPENLRGRATDVDRLIELLGEPGVVYVTGPAGVGKTAVVSAALQRVDTGTRAAYVRCRSARAVASFDPVGRVVRTLFGGAAGAIELERLIAERPRGAAALERIRALASDNASFDAFELAWATRRFLRAVAPCIVALDDAHQLSPAMHEFLRRMHDRPEPGVRVVCMSQQAELPTRELALSPLSNEHVSELLSSRGVGAHDLDRVTAAARGIPLYALHAARAVANGDRSLPESLPSLIAARVAALPSSERVTLGVLSLSIEPMTEEAAAVVTGAQGRAAGAALMALTEEGFVTRTDKLHDVAHDVVAAVARAALSKEVSSRAHRALAESAPAGSVTAAFHREHVARLVDDAEAGPRAAADLRAVGRKALASSDLPVAVDLLDRSTTLVEDAETLFDLGDALAELGDGRSALEVAARIEALGSHDLAGVLRAHVDPAAAAPERPAEGRPAIVAAMIDAREAWESRDAAVVRAALERGLHMARAIGSGRDAAKAASWLLNLVYGGPIPLDEAVAICEAVRDGAGLVLEARALATEGALHALKGDCDRAREMIAAAEDLEDDLDQIPWLSGTPALATEAALVCGDPDAAEEHVRRGSRGVEELSPEHAAATAALVARVALARGRVDAARDALGDAAGPGVELVRAKVLAAAGDLDGAIDGFEALLRELSPGFEPKERADVLLALGVARARRDPDAAVGPLEEAARLFDEKGASARAAVVKEVLANLPVRPSSMP